MSDILNEPVDSAFVSSGNDGSLFDSNIDYIDTFDDVYNDTYFNDNYENLSTTSNTTPEFSSPNDHFTDGSSGPDAGVKNELHDHFYYLNNYDYRPFRHVKSASFSLPDKLNMLNISQPSSKSPSPEFIYAGNKDTKENPTINPQDIFTLSNQNQVQKSKKDDTKQRRTKKPKDSGDKAGAALKAGSKYASVNEFTGSGSANGGAIFADGDSLQSGSRLFGMGGQPSGLDQVTVSAPQPLFSDNSGGVAGNAAVKELPNDYILPSSSSSPNLTSMFNHYNRTKGDVDFKMNNECFNAIKSWLNANDVNNDTDNEILINPTGIIKNTTLSKRRNSIQMVNHATAPVVSAIDKRRRRKSTNSNASLNEFKSLMLNNDLNIEDKKSLRNSKDSEKSDSTGSSVSPQPMKANTSVSGPHGAGYQRNNSQLIDREEVLRQTIQSINFSQLEEEGKPFPCPDCNKQFKRSEHLKRHIRSVHSNIRPFHCKYCEKQFSRSDNLAQHLKTHYKLNSNGTTSIIYGNPSLHNRGGRRKNSSSGNTQPANLNSGSSAGNNSGNGSGYDLDMNMDTSTGTSSEYDT